MGDAWIFLEDDLPLVCVIGGIVLLGLFLIKEWGTRKRPGWPFRLLAAVLALAALTGIALRPAYLQKVAGRQAAVLSQGFSEKQLDSLRRKHPGLPVIRYQPGDPLDLDPGISSVYLLGYGLASYDLWQLEGLQVHYAPPAEMPSGVARLQVSDPSILGGMLSVQGLYANPKGGHQLILKDPGENPVDSVLLEAGPSSPFRLSSRSKAPGNLTYFLEETDSSGQVVRRDPLPFRVRRPNPLRILILNTFPTFETKYLKNFLEEKGNEILLRSQLSRGLYKFEYINTEKRPVYALTRERLQEFDLVISDSESYRGLSRASRSALEESIANDGTGLFLQPDEAFFRWPERLRYFAFKPDGILRLETGKQDRVLEKYPFSPELGFPVKPVLIEDAMRIGIERPVGNGKVVTTTVRNSYQWVLKGQSGFYAAFWSGLLNAAAGMQRPAAEWETLTRLPRMDVPFDFRLRTAVREPHAVNQTGQMLPLSGDLLVEELWKGRDYPSENGWNRIRLSRDSLPDLAYYVYDQGDWPGLEISQTMKDNHRFHNSENDLTDTVDTYVPIRRLWFYILFLGAMAWLWLEPRLMPE